MASIKQGEQMNHYIVICLDDDGRYVQGTRKRFTKKEAEKYAKSVDKDRYPVVVAVPALEADSLGYPVRNRDGSFVLEKTPTARVNHRKLSTQDEIEAVCYLYYQTKSNVSQIAGNLRVSTGVVDRVLRENGLMYRAVHKEEIEEYLGKK